MKKEKKIEVKGFPLIKIKSKEIIEKMIKGSFYMNSLKVFREMYDENDDVVGDPNEGKLIISNGNVIIPGVVDEEVHNYPFATSHQDDFVFCMFGVNPEKYDNFVFSEEQKEQLKGFDDTALIITDTSEFCKRVNRAAELKGYEISCGFVIYYDEESDDVGRLFSLMMGGMGNIVFYKTQKYSYQQEFRFAVENKTGEDHIELDIGDISDISYVLPVEQLFDGIVAKR